MNIRYHTQLQIFSCDESNIYSLTYEYAVQWIINYSHFRFCITIRDIIYLYPVKFKFDPLHPFLPTYLLTTTNTFCIYELVFLLLYSATREHAYFFWLIWFIPLYIIITFSLFSFIHQRTFQFAHSGVNNTVEICRCIYLFKLVFSFLSPR